MMKMKDFFCLFVGFALLALAFLMKGYGEESVLPVPKSSAECVAAEQKNIAYPFDPLLHCQENGEEDIPLAF